MRKILLVGWDGADPDLVTRWLAEGKLPHLASIQRQGVLKAIDSTVRPESSVAWTTFATGMLPGWHGVFGFTRQMANSYQTTLNTGIPPQIASVWERVSLAGYRVAILNMPMSYPPRRVNGWLVCGQMTPPDASVFTYPPDLSSRLRQEGYAIDAEAIRDGEERAAYVARMCAQVEQRTDVAIRLLREQDWDLAIVVHTELDRLQHFFWSDMDENHPLRPSHPVAGAIESHYATLDRALGRLVGEAGQDTIVVVMSDHGFGPCARAVNLNTWLREAGLLKLKPMRAFAVSKVSSWLNWAKTSSSLMRLKHAFLGRSPVFAQFERSADLKAIDWSGTQAWYCESGGIRINLRGREPEGIVEPGEYDALCDQIINAARELRDPHTNLPVFEIVAHRESLYDGPMTNLAPDIILDTYHPSSTYFQNHVVKWRLGAGESSVFGWSAPYTGTHTRRALFATTEASAVEEVKHLKDVAGWICRHFGCAAHQASTDFEPVAHLKSYEEKALRERLRALGYLE